MLPLTPPASVICDSIIVHYFLFTFSALVGCPPWFVTVYSEEGQLAQSMSI